MNAAVRMPPGHLLSVCCLVVLAVLRLTDGSWVWAGVFALAAVAQFAVGLRLRRPPMDDGSRHPGSGARQEQRAGRWRVLTASSCVLSAVLLVVQPALGLVAALTGLYCLWMTGRVRPASTSR
jgi:cobalamin synthase